MIDNGIEVHDENVLWFTTSDRDKMIENFAIDTIKDCTAVICYNDQVAVKMIEILKTIILKCRMTWQL